ncbi:hypothetical protein FEM03_23565 [Phragmitibacter flavus]|uniref:Toprim domain-containing protein n=1 Tax=Phragmitibacter flavus TaxID=2576071 RepID=A0A5R8K7F6_9BACT|nr:toprim domain-containing protein [Phragmitibacter flavus]TLD68298.1 hypothetical protein FEM03_23565 [Phragmitibacter flavus]
MNKFMLERAGNYLEKLPPSLQGSKGSDSLFDAACTLIKGFAFSQEDALPLLFQWNQTHCVPPWSESELRQKLRSAANSTRPTGYLLQSQPIQSPRPMVAANFENDSERKARLRHGWPAFLTLQNSAVEAVARLRNLPADSVWLAHRSGVLRGAKIDGHSCFIIHEGTFAQARRFDGLPFTLADGKQVKAKNLPGSEGAFIGQKWLGGPSVKVLLVEGAIALLEALAAYLIVLPPHGWTILAATSASSRFSRAPGLVKQLNNRSVRIVPDCDKAGLDAAASWITDLESAGCKVDIRALPSSCKDLGPLLADASSHAATLNALFE